MSSMTVETPAPLAGVSEAPAPLDMKVPSGKSSDEGDYRKGTCSQDDAKPRKVQYAPTIAHHEPSRHSSWWGATSHIVTGRWNLHRLFGTVCGAAARGCQNAAAVTARWRRLARPGLVRCGSRLQLHLTHPCVSAAARPPRSRGWRRCAVPGELGWLQGGSRLPPGNAKGLTSQKCTAMPLQRSALRARG